MSEVQHEWVSPGPVGAPDDGCWIEAKGHRWATNRDVLVREDGPLPDPAAGRLPRKPSVNPPPSIWSPVPGHHVAGLLDQFDHPSHAFVVHRIGLRGATVMWEGDKAGVPFLVEIDPAYDSCLTADQVDEVRGRGTRQPLVAYRAGEVIAVVSPRAVP